jgi:hypothetical protein
MYCRWPIRYAWTVHSAFSFSPKGKYTLGGKGNGLRLRVTPAKYRVSY